MSLTKALILSIMFVMSAACASAQVNITDVSGQKMPLLRLSTPPAIYEDWWNYISSCSQVALPEDHAQRTTWVLVPARPFKTSVTHYNDDAMILTDSTSRDVVIFVNYTGIVDRGLVTHEMQHALLFWKFGQKTVGQHPAPYYSQCGLVEIGQQKP